MLSATVAQKPTMPVSDGIKKRRNSALVRNLLGALSTGPRPPALPDPPQQQQADAEHEGRADAFQEFDGFDAAPDDGDVERPEDFIRKLNAVRRLGFHRWRSEAGFWRSANRGAPCAPKLPGRRPILLR